MMKGLRRIFQGWLNRHRHFRLGFWLRLHLSGTLSSLADLASSRRIERRNVRLQTDFNRRRDIDQRLVS